nr:immunoglobulin light chain junction region [Macaca mulatta]
CQRHNSYPTF